MANAVVTDSGAPVVTDTGAAVVAASLGLQVRVEAVGWNCWRLHLRSERATPVTFRVYRDGALETSLLSDTGEAEYVVSTGYGDAPVFELLDDPAAAPSPVYPARLLFGWAHQPDAVAYTVSEYTGGAWVERATVWPASAGADWCEYLTAALDDGLAARWKIVPVDAAGNSGAAVEFLALIVRQPDAPDVTLAYSESTRKVTITAA